ncbi:hypothetical protein [Massilibacteroides sp.]|nr:hypothetical protein [Massilibacteroides sp.]MDD4516570.1 hypothetical protein [Massilibacteroides sp.]
MKEEEILAMTKEVLTMTEEEKLFFLIGYLAGEKLKDIQENDE